MSTRALRLARRLVPAVLLLLSLATFTPSLASAEAACPNEQLRAENHSTNLPDCRAYELVTPPFKYGGFPVSPYGVTDAGLLFSTLGAPGEPGDSSTTGGPSYVARRGGSGWLSESVEASAELFRAPFNGSGEGIEDISRDLSTTVIDRAPLSSTSIDKRLYLRGPDGSPVLIGPTVPPAAAAAWTQHDAEDNNFPFAEYVGASPDLSHVIFRSVAPEPGQGMRTDFLWPGDRTVGAAIYSLYEYVGTGHTGIGGDVPALVGVSDGTTVVDGRRIPAGVLISQCGVTLGSANVNGAASLDMYNAISERSASPEPSVTGEEGAKVFFTARRAGCSGLDASGHVVAGEGPAVDELYARVNGSRTVAISEPTRADCAECNTTEAESTTLSVAERIALQADFQGASADGSKVFFLTKQRLLPAAGAGEGPFLYEYDFNASDPHRKVALIAAHMPESSVAINPNRGEPNSGVVRLSQDGSRLYLVSEAVLATNRDSKGATAEAGIPSLGKPRYNLYVYNTLAKRYTFIAPLGPRDETDWRVFDTRHAVASPGDGRYLLFLSTNDLTPGSTGPAPQIYRYDAETGEAEALAEAGGHPEGKVSLLRVSIANGGPNENGIPAVPQGGEPASTMFPPNQYATGDKVAPVGVPITADGSMVFFQSPLALTPGVPNNVCVYRNPERECEAYAANVYEYENGTVRLISDGQDTHAIQFAGASRLLGATPSGSDVYISTADPLTAADTDTQLDFYDARVGGGFPTPASPSSGCAGNECAARTAPPAFVLPSSSSGGGEGNLPPTVPTAQRPGSTQPTAGQRLAKALHACHRLRAKRKRSHCESVARARYGPRHGHTTRRAR